MPVISVLMPVYNAEKFLTEAIESIINQEFSDFEYIIINDFSNDRTADILKVFQKRDQRIRIINNQARLGIARSLNRGLALARGSYLARMDGDDISDATRFGKQKEFLDCHPEAGIVGSWFRVIDADNRLQWQVSPFCDHKDLFSFSLATNQFCHGSIMGRKEVFRNLQGYNAQFEPADDYDLWLRVMEKYRVYNLADYLYQLRTHQDSVSIKESVLQSQNAVRARLNAIERRELNYKKAMLFSEEWKERCFYYNYGELIQDKKVLICGQGWPGEKTLDLILKIGCELKGLAVIDPAESNRTFRGYSTFGIKEIATLVYDYIVIADQAWLAIRDQLIEQNVDRSKIIYSLYT